MAKQLVYFSNTQSARTPIASMDKLNRSYGTATQASTTLNMPSIAMSTTYQFIPNTTGNATAFTTGGAADSKGWIYESQFSGRYWPGTWTIQVYVFINNGGGLNIGQQGEASARIFLVTPGSSAVALAGNFSTSVVAAAAQVLGVGNFTFTMNFVVNNFVYCYPNDYIYVELYFTASGTVLATTAGLWLESPNTFMTTPFFEDSSNYISPNR